MVIDEQKKIKINMKEHISDNKKGKRLKGKKVKRKNGKKVIIVLALIILLSASYYIYIRFFEKKFKDVTIELGTESVELIQFVSEERFLNQASFITEIFEPSKFYNRHEQYRL